MDRKTFYGELSEPENFSVRKLWLFYRRKLVPAYASRFQVEALEAAFHAGFYECFDFITDFCSELPEGKAGELLERLSEERLLYTNLLRQRAENMAKDLKR